MNKPSGCKSCPSGWRTLIARKLGRCPRCMRLSALGTLAGWSITAVAALAWPYPALLTFALLIAAGFTTLLVAHVIAFTARVAPALTTATLTTGDAATPDAPAISRRRVVANVATAAVGGITVALFARVPAGLAQAACAGTHEKTVELGPTGTCEECAEQIAALKLDIICTGLCGTFPPCHPPNTVCMQAGPGRVVARGCRPRDFCRAIVACQCRCGVRPRRRR